jgi:AraC-like DNA-binding protein
MQQLQPYLQNDCNLAYMAKLTGLPAHHLAYYFREERRQPFNNYRNLWRVQHAKNLVLEGKTRELTLEAIGQLSGFSSRSAFFTAFKKVEEISPSAFAAQFIK